MKEKWISTNKFQVPVDQVPDCPTPILAIITKIDQIVDHNMCLVVNIDDGDYYFYDSATGSIGKKLSDEKFIVSYWITIEWPDIAN